MQSIELQNIRPQIRFYVKKENPADRIAGLFYYSSAAILWTMCIAGLIAFLVIFLFSPGMALVTLLMAVILGFPGWIWAGIGVILFCCYRSRFKSEMGKGGAVALWILTIWFNGSQALFIFFNLNDFAFGNVVAGWLGNVVGGWNLIIAALSVFALYFELKES